MSYLRYIVLVTALCWAGCANDTPPPNSDTIPDTTATASAAVASPQGAFWSKLESLCGQAFAGTALDAPEGDDTFADATLVMHVRQCFGDEIRIPFHVGEDRSRTWIISQTDDGLRLKHDHRHDDGSEDEITQYGGDTDDDGTATRQSFPADAFTADLLPAAASNVWSVEVTNEAYTYTLVRENTGARYEIAFDLTEPVDPPPASWGYEDTAPTHKSENT